MLQSYKLRIDTKEVATDWVLEYLETHSNNAQHAWCYEGDPDKNPHIHAYFATTTKQATLRSQLRKAGLKGNGSYSLKLLEEQYPIEYFAYMLKEGRADISRLPKDIQRQAKEHNKKVVDSIKELKKSRKSVIDGILERLQDAEVADKRPTTIAIQDAILDYHRENKILVRRFQIQAYRDTIELRYSTNDAMRHLFG